MLGASPEKVGTGAVLCFNSLRECFFQPRIFASQDIVHGLHGFLEGSEGTNLHGLNTRVRVGLIQLALMDFFGFFRCKNIERSCQGCEIIEIIHSIIDKFM